MTLLIAALHFGIIMTVSLAIGQATPPVGVDLFVACGISKVSLGGIRRAVVPFIIAEAGALVAISYLAALSEWLPGLLR